MATEYSRFHDRLLPGKTYHVFNKSIQKFVIFNDADEYKRMLLCSLYFKHQGRKQSFSHCWRLVRDSQDPLENLRTRFLKDRPTTVRVLAWCFMPTHFHFMLKETEKGGISTFINHVENSYARYFNLRHHRRGPLWCGPFGHVRLDSTVAVLNNFRYIHRNPAFPSGQVNWKWPWCSYGEYFHHPRTMHRLTETDLEKRLHLPRLKAFIHAEDPDPYDEKIWEKPRPG